MYRWACYRRPIGTFSLCSVTGEDLSSLAKSCRRGLYKLNKFGARIRRGPYMYEMQGPRPVRRCWLTDCSAARHCLTDHCYRIPVRDAGCPAPQPFPELPPGAVPSPDTRPGCRSPGSPAVPEVIPEISIRSRHPSEAPVAQLLSRFRSCPRNWHLIPGYPPGMPVARLSGRPRSFLRERYPSLAVMNFYSLDLTRHKGFLAAI